MKAGVVLSLEHLNISSSSLERKVVGSWVLTEEGAGVLAHCWY